MILVPDHLDMPAPYRGLSTARRRHGHLYRLAVHPSSRREGVGSTLLAAAEERFAALDGRRADAMVLDRNAVAHHAWRAAGYGPEPQWSRWVKHLADR
ncbi:hypothetical protein SCALM49S_04245 [Streptomyces californicus]